MDLQIDWASLTVGSKYTLFVLFYFVFEGNFPSTSPPGGGGGGFYLQGRFNGGFFVSPVWGTYVWRVFYMGWAYFRNLTVSWRALPILTYTQTNLA